MSTPDLPGNSHKARAQPEPVETKQVSKVVQGTVTIKKKSIGKRLKGIFFGGEDAQSVFGYVAFEVLIPAARDMFADAGMEAVHRMFYGDSRSSRRTTGYGRSETGPYINYQSASSGGRRPQESHDRHRASSRRPRSVNDYNEVIIPTRVEAEVVLERLFDLISRYEVATVADLYDLCDLQASHTDNKWGWMELPGARIVHTRHGYMLDLPRPEPLD